MKDSNNNEANDEASASDATYTQKNTVKPSSTNRTSDIYERFLNRVQSMDSDGDRADVDNGGNRSNEVIQINSDGLKSSLDSLDKFKNSSSYEPLNEEELRYFTNHEDAINPEESDITSIDIDFNDDFDGEDNKNGKKQKAASVGAYVLNNKNIELSAEDTKAQKTKSTSSRSLLIIGVVSSLLLGAVIMVLLNKTGFLSTSTVRLDADSSKVISAATSSTPTAGAEQLAVIEPNKVPVLNTETPVTTKPQVDQNLLDNDNDAAVNPQEALARQQPIEGSTSNLETEPAISLEDFREEAQNTLYRETKD